MPHGKYIIEASISPIVSNETVLAELTGVSEQLGTCVPVTPLGREVLVGQLDLDSLGNAECVHKILDISDRELGKLSNLSAATAKKYRKIFMSMQSVAGSDT